VDRLGDIAFPYRAKKSFGAASFALLFLVLLSEIELLFLIALGVIAHRFDLFVDLQPTLLPVACLIALAAATVFWWRARRWTRTKIELLNVWAQGGTAGGGAAYGEKLALKRMPKRVDGMRES
jgi:hypothetical protein